METIEVLSREQETELARRVEAGVFAQHLLATSGGTAASRAELAFIAAEGDQAWQTLWLANVGMVRVLAARYGRGQREIIEDLTQEGFIALAEALMRYDWTRGVRVCTHSWHWVRSRLMAVMRKRSGWERTTTEVNEGIQIAAPVVEVDASELAQVALSVLNGTERAVMLARAEGLAQRDTAQRLGMGVMTVRTIEQRAIRRARQALEDQVAA